MRDKLSEDTTLNSLFDEYISRQKLPDKKTVEHIALPPLKWVGTKKTTEKFFIFSMKFKVFKS